MSLSDLPDEILNLISSQLNGFDNFFLWMASDSKLKHRLVNNVITDFDIIYTTLRPRLWPGNFLKKLKRLSRLSLVANRDVDHIPIQNVELYPIQTLNYLSLNLRCSQIDSILSTYFTTFDPRVSDPSSDSTSDSTESPTVTPISLNDLYPNLDYLELINPGSRIEYSIDFLRGLPPKLRTFSVPSNELTIQSRKGLDESIEALPRTLTELKIHFDHDHRNIPSLDLSKLPPNLTSLDTSVPIDVDKPYDMVIQGLKTCYLSVKPCDILKLAPLLPTGLERLSIGVDASVPSNQLLSYLETLESLQYLFTNPQKALEVSNLNTKCPPNLNSLVCMNIRFAVFPSGFFGQKLTRIALNYVVGLTREFFSILPPSLSDLTVSVDNSTLEQSFDFFTLLPSNLKCLTTNLNITENISLLPKSLTFLSLRVKKACDPSHIDMFPPKLETLIFTGRLPQSIFKDLPDTLQHMDIVSDVVVDDEIVRMLPRGLKAFHLDTTDMITDVGATHFPPNLETLYLYKNTNMTDDAIGSLPRSLTNIKLTSPHFTDECVKHLPRNLITLRLEMATKVTLRSAKDFPRYMKTLYLPMCDDWTTDVSSEMPPFLKSFFFAYNPQARQTSRRVSNYY